MEMIERYVYAVVHRLPKQQQADIEKELRGLIEDMLEERMQGEQPTEREVEAVLTELGNPSELAASYRGNKRFLIGPQLMDSYMTVLKIVAVSVLIGLSIVFVIRLIVEPVTALDAFVDYIVSLVMASLQCFAWVTIGFAIAEYRGNLKSLHTAANAKSWTPAELQPVPDAKNEIGIAEPMIVIVVLMGFLAVLLSATDLLGFPMIIDGNAKIITAFDFDVLRGYMPGVIAVVLIIVAREIYKLILRKWTHRLIGIHVLVSVVATIFAYILLSDTAVWNPSFMDESVAAGIVIPGSETYETVEKVWGYVQKWTLVGIIFGTVIDIIFTLLKLRRMR